MGITKSTAENKRECRWALSTELSKCAERVASLLVIQLTGDFSAETARKINLLSYHIEVLENRLNGTFTASPSPSEGGEFKNSNYQY